MLFHYLLAALFFLSAFIPANAAISIADQSSAGHQERPFKWYQVDVPYNNSLHLTVNMQQYIPYQTSSLQYVIPPMQSRERRLLISNFCQHRGGKEYAGRLAAFYFLAHNPSNSGIKIDPDKPSKAVAVAFKQIGLRVEDEIISNELVRALKNSPYVIAPEGHGQGRSLKPNFIFTSTRINKKMLDQLEQGNSARTPAVLAMTVHHPAHTSAAQTDVWLSRSPSRFHRVSYNLFELEDDDDIEIKGDVLEVELDREKTMTDQNWGAPHQLYSGRYKAQANAAGKAMMMVACYDN